MPTSTTTSTAGVKSKDTVKDLIRENWSAIQGTVPDAITPKRFANLVANSIRKTPALAQATPASLLGAMLSAAAVGLEVDTPLDEAYLVPYKRRLRDGGTIVEVQLIIGYKGMIRLYRQHPDAAAVTSGWVGANDEFDYAYGTNPYLRHKPVIGGDRGEPIAYWASYTLKDGTSEFVVLTPEDVADLRGKAVDAKRDVKDPQHWMERKTVLKQVLKTAPQTTKIALASRIDEQPITTVIQTPGMEHVAAAITPSEHVDHTTGEITSEAGPQA